jgi:hypothetical protein|tara:strand:- start:48 stop:791 length:744 start_codon:yes stop_codon:yes gene_type:complete
MKQKTILIISIIIITLTIGTTFYLLQNSKTQQITTQLNNCLKNNSNNSNTKPEKSKDNTPEFSNNNSKSILIKVNGEMNYIIYIDETGKEFIIDKAPWNRKQWTQDGEYEYYSYRAFSHAKFSPKENYILYTTPTDESALIIKLYDIANQKFVEEIYGKTIEFSPDEKYIYTCDPDFETSAKVYETIGFKELHNVFGKTLGEGETEFNNGYRISSCNWEAKNQRVRFHLENRLDRLDSKDVYFTPNN